MLQDQVEPGPVEDVAEVLQRELGAPASQLFAEFEPEARAAASLAQVLPPMHPYMGASLCVHHTATCSPLLVPAYVHIILSHAALHCLLSRQAQDVQITMNKSSASSWSASSWSVT